MLRVFVKKGCGVCKSVVRQLEERGVKFEAIDVGTRQGLEEAERYGVDIGGTILDESDRQLSVREAIERYLAYQ